MAGGRIKVDDRSYAQGDRKTNHVNLNKDVVRHEIKHEKHLAQSNDQGNINW